MSLSPENLKPCPFCAEIPTSGPDNPAREGNAWGYVACFNKKCPTFDSTRGHGVWVEDGVDVADERGSAAYRRAAVRRWNRRPTPRTKT